MSDFLPPPPASDQPWAQAGPYAYTNAPDLSKGAFSDRLWENYAPRITWQATQRDQITFSWDEQPVCRTCTGPT